MNLSLFRKKRQIPLLPQVNQSAKKEKLAYPIWVIQIIMDDLSDEIGVRLPKLTLEAFNQYADRMAWAKSVVATIRVSGHQLGAKKNDCC